MPFYQLFYHLVWTTKNREPLLLPSVEPVILDFLRSKAIGLGGVLLGIGGVFFWQEEYGAFSFDSKRLPNYIAYVGHQKEHHAQGTTIPILERTSGEGVVRIGESAGLYVVSDVAWRAELENMAVVQLN